MLEYYIENKIYIGLAAELVAAIAAILILQFGKPNEKVLRIFAYYVIGIFLADLIGGYPIYAYFNNYGILGFVKDTPFERSHWWYNLVQFFSFFLFTYVLGSGLKNRRYIKLLKIASIGFFIFSLLRFFWLGDFLLNRDIGMEMAGTGLILLSSGLYFMELLQSDRILRFGYNFRFYVALGASIFYLIFIPIEIFSLFITEQNPDYVKFHAAVLRYIAIFMYGMFSIGFYMHYRGKKQESSTLN